MYNQVTFINIGLSLYLQIDTKIKNKMEGIFMDRLFSSKKISKPRKDINGYCIACDTTCGTSCRGSCGTCSSNCTDGCNGSCVSILSTWASGGCPGNCASSCVSVSF